ncbi:unnamed protein product [Toxocara canis]|uniref:Uncharacterized protein n=1 Tax=Toxocara canis TaxID=6265 RepID=A0A183UQ89_TOXCA|nr:unnamed protein product [Toxocara canis]
MHGLDDEESKAPEKRYGFVPIHTAAIRSLIWNWRQRGQSHFHNKAINPSYKSMTQECDPIHEKRKGNINSNDITNYRPIPLLSTALTRLLKILWKKPHRQFEHRTEEHAGKKKNQIQVLAIAIERTRHTTCVTMKNLVLHRIDWLLEIYGQRPETTFSNPGYPTNPARFGFFDSLTRSKNTEMVKKRSAKERLHVSNGIESKSTTRVRPKRGRECCWQ